ncbi:hypothetical protein FCH30_14015 [Acinetobacter radioresistens]|uniref:hypothetical protein n=1 Tax=Acinetobacter radioresistens TaxID=40216 RepID=UPI00157ACC74|nr:hypothetical protein [Acinetobacter radioresistens]NTY98315.1 hypothetical protein [Acinetobacter radioresistens]
MDNLISIESLVFSPIVFVLSLILSLKVCNLFKVGYKLSLILYLWHSLFCFIYIWFSFNFSADSKKYFLLATQDGNRDFGFGTSFIVYITYIFNNFFSLSYIDQFLIHNFIGYIGLLAFAAAINQVTLDKQKSIRILGWAIIFLPSVSFWTTGLGKDSISFMATGLTLWAALNLKKRIGFFVFAIIAMLMVRPHMAAVMLAAYTLAFIFDKRISILQRFIIGGTAIVLSGLMIPFALQYAGLGDAENVTDVEEYIDQRQSYNLEGGSSLDISSMSLPMQLFTYLFRPLPFEANSIFALVASLDNIILLFLAVWGITAIIKKSKPSVESSRAFLWLYVLIAWLIFATTTANLGIAMRQKWMFLPCLIFLLLSVIGTKNIKMRKGLK